MPWLTLETETDRPPMRIYDRRELDRLLASEYNRDGKVRHRSYAIRKPLPPRRARYLVAEYRRGTSITNLAQRYKISEGHARTTIVEAGITISRFTWCRVPEKIGA